MLALLVTLSLSLLYGYSSFSDLISFLSLHVAAVIRVLFFSVRRSLLYTFVYIFIPPARNPTSGLIQILDIGQDCRRLFQSPLIWVIFIWWVFLDHILSSILSHLFSEPVDIKCVAFSIFRLHPSTVKLLSPAEMLRTPCFWNNRHPVEM